MTDTLAYSTHAHSRNGRQGHAHTRNNVSVDIEMPKIPNGVSRKGATTPEDLFAAAYAACFGGTLDAIIRADDAPASIHDLDLIINLNRADSGDFNLAAGFAISLNGVDQSTAEALVHKAHQACPYSRAVRNNINVTFDVRSL